MSFNEQLNNRIREALEKIPDVEEKWMFGGTCFMVNGKMCTGVIKNEMMCRIGPENYEMALEKPGCHEMVFTTRTLQGYVLVAEDAIRSKKELAYWINLCLEFNVHAKASKKKPKK